MCVHVLGSGEKTPLHEAAKHGQVSTATLLMNSGAKLDAADESGDTPVHWAARYGRKQ